MSRKIILLNLALLALAGTLIWQARRHYLDIKAHQREILQRAVQARPVLPPPTMPAQQPVSPVQYSEVAQKDLFTKDRNPIVIIEPPQPKPEPPMPALPAYFGQIDLGDPVIFLSTRGGDQKRFRAGDKVGDFQLVSFDREKITFSWNDKTVEKKIEDLKAKGDQPGAARTAQEAPDPATNQRILPTYQAPAPPGAPARNTSGPQVKSIGGDSSSNDVKDPAAGGPITGTDFRGCQMNDASPAGTVKDGYRKVVTRTLMGNSCYWEKVK
jgi:hypothetical protein